MKAHILKPNVRKRSGAGSRNSCAVANEERNCVAAAKNGDSVAFGILCTRCAGMVFSIARRIVPTNEDAEDVVQESFRLAFTHLKSFKGDSRFSTWLTRIVTNAALMRLRKNNVRRELPLDELAESQGRLSRFDLEDPSSNPEKLHAQKERHGMLRKAVNELPPKIRKAIELRDLDERSTRETARMMGISIASVKARLFHGRRKLQRLLKRMNSIHYGDESPAVHHPLASRSLIWAVASTSLETPRRNPPQRLRPSVRGRSDANSTQGHWAQSSCSGMVGDGIRNPSF